MKLTRIRLLAASLTAAFVVTSTFTRADSGPSNVAPLDRGRFVMPYGFSLNTGERILSFEDDLDEEENIGEESIDGNRLFVAGNREKAWLLEPDTFNRLSS